MNDAEPLPQPPKCQSPDCQSPDCQLPDCQLWLIDGYNLLHASLGGQDRSQWWTAARREDLLARVRAFGGPGSELWVVFDGKRPLPEGAGGAEGTERVRVVFAPSADEWIRRRIRDSDEREDIGVVTGDRPVADRARHRGARVVSPRLFLQHCPAPDLT